MIYTICCFFNYFCNPINYFMRIKHYLYLLLFLSSCGTSSVMVSVQRPADITVPHHIKKVIVSNRSTPSKKNLAENIVEGIVTGEGIGSDKKGSEYCTQGLIEMLSNSERYELKNSGELTLKGTGTSEFPKLLSWKKVKKLCNSYEADALIVLSTFDSDSRYLEEKSYVRTKKIKGVKVKEVLYPVTLIMEIESGWRIYDSKKEKIIDVNRFTEVKEFQSVGSSYNDARLRLPAKRKALKLAGVFAGEKYGLRISPIWIKVRREYFIGKGEDLKIAQKHVKLGDWDSASQIWISLTSHSDLKVSRRAYFNLALSAEIRGKIDVAIEYAKKSLSLGEKRASSYIKVLNLRKIDQQKLEEQLKE